MQNTDPIPDEESKLQTPPRDEIAVERRETPVDQAWLDEQLVSDNLLLKLNGQLEEIDKWENARVARYAEELRLVQEELAAAKKEGKKIQARIIALSTAIEKIKPKMRYNKSRSGGVVTQINQRRHFLKQMAVGRAMSQMRRDLTRKFRLKHSNVEL